MATVENDIAVLTEGQATTFAVLKRRADHRCYRNGDPKKVAAIMTERNDLLASIADRIKDYRDGEFAVPTMVDHVNRWINQFDPEVQVPILCELDYVFAQTYVSKLTMHQFLTDTIDQFSYRFWQSARILDIQETGRSQSEIVKLVDEIISKKYGIKIADGESKNGDIVYFDDAVFTGNRVSDDLKNMFQRSQHEKRLHIIAFAIHTRAKEKIKNKFAHVNVKVNVLYELCFENRHMRNPKNGELAPTDVLRPSEITERKQSERKSCLFSSVESRQLLENEFLRKDKEILEFPSKPNPLLKPLGYNNRYKNSKLGFGSLLVTYRRCPNTCPLAFWWGNPSPTHPFDTLRHWYPLFPRF